MSLAYSFLEHGVLKGVVTASTYYAYSASLERWPGWVGPCDICFSQALPGVWIIVFYILWVWMCHLYFLCHD